MSRCPVASRAGVDAGCYARLTEIAGELGAKVLLDTSGASLDAALAGTVKPYLVKPNLSELSALLGCELSSDDVIGIRNAIDADGRFDGVAWVVVSMALPAPPPSTTARSSAPCPRASTA